jgi:hypothetical protein
MLRMSIMWWISSGVREKKGKGDIGANVANVDEDTSHIMNENENVSRYRPVDCYVVHIWVEARFLHPLLIQRQCRGPREPWIRTQVAILAQIQMEDVHTNAQKRLAMTAYASILISMVKFHPFLHDRMGAPVLTIDRLVFLRLREALATKLFQSHWWHDLQQGRKRGRGDEVYRQASNVRLRIYIYLYPMDRHSDDARDVVYGMYMLS